MTTPLTKLIENGGWRPVEEAKDGYNYITEMKHGIISGEFDAREGTCGGYYWRSMDWFPHKIMETDTPQRMAEVIKVLLKGLSDIENANSVFEDTASEDPWQHIAAITAYCEEAIQQATAIAEGKE